MKDYDDEDETLGPPDPMKKTTARRKRRRANAKLKNAKAVRPHREKTGRTGQVWEKTTHGKTSRYTHAHPNSPWQTRRDW